MVSRYQKYKFIVEDYVSKNHEVKVDTIQLLGDRVSEKSFKIKNQYDELFLDKDEFLKEIQLIFDDIDKPKSVALSVASKWYRFEVSMRMDDINSKLRFIESYFSENVNLKLTRHNWLPLKKTGENFTINGLIKELNESNDDFKWVTDRIIRHFYEKWYDDEVVNISERMMGFS